MEEQEHSTDVVVAGGGVAGTLAAISAARLGCQVVLIQDRSILGGNASSEIGVGLAGADSSGTSLIRYGRETGLVGEYALEMLHRAHTPAGIGPLRSLLLWEMACRESRLRVFLNTALRAADVEASGAIRSVRAYQVSTECDHAFRARVFIDCTGHGTLGALAGAEFRQGREGREEFGESLAPAHADRGVMGCTICWRARNMHRPVPFIPPSWAAVFPSDESLPFRPHGAEFFEGKEETAGYWWLEYGGLCDPIRDAETIHHELLRIVYGIWNHIKNGGDHGAANWELVWVSPLAAPRESRRLMGDVLLTENDVRERILFPDRVAYAGWGIDIHVPGGVYSAEPPMVAGQLLSDTWSLPLRALYSRNVPNLLMAGRDISVTHVALGSARVVATCGLMGQAAGTAAALCCREGLAPRELAERRIESLQQQLLRDDCHLIDLPNADPRDLARRASIVASSEAVLEPGIAEDWTPLDRPMAQVFPVSAARVDCVELRLRSSAPGPIRIVAGLRAAARINDLADGPDVALAEAVVPPGAESWVRFDFGAAVEPQRFYWIHLPVVPGVAWALQRQPLLGTHRASRVAEPFLRWRSFAPVFCPGGQRGMFLFRLTPSSHPYGAANVLSGVNRPERFTNIWISSPAQPLPQTLEVSMARPSEVASVHVTFDDDLDNNIYHPRPWGRLSEGTVSTLVKDYRLLAAVGSRWQEVIRVEGNYQRHRVHAFPRLQTACIRLECLATHGSPEARVYGLRIYS
jgi:hypothetical protein